MQGTDAYVLWGSSINDKSLFRGREWAKKCWKVIPVNGEGGGSSALFSNKECYHFIMGDPLWMAPPKRYIHHHGLIMKLCNPRERSLWRKSASLVKHNRVYFTIVDDGTWGTTQCQWRRCRRRGKKWMCFAAAAGRASAAAAIAALCWLHEPRGNFTSSKFYVRNCALCTYAHWAGLEFGAKCPQLWLKNRD